MSAKRARRVAGTSLYRPLLKELSEAVKYIVRITTITRPKRKLPIVKATVMTLPVMVATFEALERYWTSWSAPVCTSKTSRGTNDCRFSMNWSPLTLCAYWTIWVTRALAWFTTTGMTASSTPAREPSSTRKMTRIATGRGTPLRSRKVTSGSMPRARKMAVPT
ncbi:hypothetical protein CMMCA002_07535 [Clavibacter michiganensis subsp. michiganensis]|nr:hypothetical protein CMMCA002_07535 [Clavibacter michiganensis subsp. michiganensis]